jgi:hypothetical protein
MITLTLTLIKENVFLEMVAVGMIVALESFNERLVGECVENCCSFGKGTVQEARGNGAHWKPLTSND